MMIYCVIAVISAYLAGSVPASVWVGKIFYRVDVREHGSGNAGATNVIRVLGYKAGIPVLLFDIFKGWFAVDLIFIVPLAYLTPWVLLYLPLILASAAVLGHVFPVFAGFRGGKGVGTFAGIAIALFPYALLVVLGIFIFVLILSRYVSLSSIIAGFSFPFIVIFLTHEARLPYMLLSIAAAVFIPLTHVKNIRRLLHGEEKRFDFARKDSKKQSP